ncbi:MAG TPA: hypothetical protein VI387_00375 [Candidatus Brocadiales bacterium]|nr:hypothetical protein [Candidatus Brocadiales bacterium]
METMGWVKATYPLGDVRLQISTSGMVYVEGKGEQFEKEYAAFIDKLRGEYPDGKIPTVHIMKVEDNPKDAIFALLDSILTKMKGIQGDNGELVKDIEVVKLELSKLTPDLRMIEIKLENLSGIDSIRDEVQELKTYLMK